MAQTSRGETPEPCPSTRKAALAQADGVKKCLFLLGVGQVAKPVAPSAEDHLVPAEELPPRLPRTKPRKHHAVSDVTAVQGWDIFRPLAAKHGHTPPPYVPSGPEKTSTSPHAERMWMTSDE